MFLTLYFLFLEIDDYWWELTTPNNNQQQLTIKEKGPFLNILNVYIVQHSLRRLELWPDFWRKILHLHLHLHLHLSIFSWKTLPKRGSKKKRAQLWLFLISQKWDSQKWENWWPFSFSKTRNRWPNYSFSILVFLKNEKWLFLVSSK